MTDAQPGSDPECRHRFDASHICISRDGRPIMGDQRCWTETRTQVHEIEQARREAASQAASW